MMNYSRVNPWVSAKEEDIISNGLDYMDERNVDALLSENRFDNLYIKWNS